MAVEKQPHSILTMNEAAESLRVSRRWFQDFLKTIPPCHLRAGRKKLFDEKAMNLIREAMRVAPGPPLRGSFRRGRRSSRDAGSALQEALALAGNRPPRTLKGPELKAGDALAILLARLDKRGRKGRKA